jgi:ABC-2 type transport system ATP-binding protein
MAPHGILVENVEKYFPPSYSGWRALLLPVARPTQPALAGVSLAVEPGEVVALIGENGGGKSTLLRILGTLLLPTRGCAWVGGFDVVSSAARVRQELGYYTGGDEGFYSRLSARENLQLFATMNDLFGAEARRSVTRVVDLLGLGDVLDRPVRTLSTGMVHRLGLARALVHGPAVLLLDEPTRSLDPLTAAEFRRFLKADIVGRHGTTLLFASHTLSEVEQLADRVALLGAGRLLACDSVRGLRASTDTPSLAQALEKLSRHAAATESLR